MNWEMNTETLEINNGEKTFYPTLDYKTVKMVVDTHNKQLQDLIGMVAKHIGPKSSEYQMNAEEYKIWKNCHRHCFPEAYKKPVIRRAATTI